VLPKKLSFEAKSIPTFIGLRDLMEAKNLFKKAPQLAENLP
jgi:hypothetical protein